MENFEEKIKRIIRGIMYFDDTSLEVIDEYSPVLVHVLSLEGEKFLEASFVDDVGLDSLDAIEVIMAAEEDFDISISDEDVMGIVQIKDLKKCIDSKTKADGEWGKHIGELLKTGSIESRGHNLAFSNPVRAPFQI